MTNLDRKNSTEDTPQIGDTVITAIGARCKITGFVEYLGKPAVDTDILVKFYPRDLRRNEAGEWESPRAKGYENK